MDRYQKVEKGLSHGEGAYGVVYKGRDKKNGDIVAMKVRPGRRRPKPGRHCPPPPTTSIITGPHRTT